MSQLTTQNENWFQRIFRILLSPYVLLALYTVHISFAISNHEVWRDEVDVWLFVRDVSSIQGFFDYLRNSGHPGLWHLVLLPFAKLGFPSVTLQVINGLFSFAAAFLFLRFCPIHSILKFLFLFGYYFAFEYSVIARNYMIAIMILFFIASIYKYRWERPVLYGFSILLLANTTFLATIIASGISLLFLVEIILDKKFSKEVILGLSLAAFGGILVMLQVIPKEESQFISMGEGVPTNPYTFVVASMFAFAPAIQNWLLGAFFSLFLLFCSFIYFLRTPRVFIFYIYSLFFLFIFYTFLYLKSYRHGGFVLLALLFAFWISFDYPKKQGSKEVYWKYFNLFFNVLVGVIFLYSVRFLYKNVNSDRKFHFSGSYLTAKFLKENHYDKPQTQILAFSADRVKTILFYLNHVKQVHFPNGDRFGSYRYWTKAEIPWEREESKFQPKAFELWATKDWDKSNILVILTLPVGKENKEKFELIYSPQFEDKFLTEEKFYIYKYKEK